MGQELLQSGAGKLLRSGAVATAEWDRYYKLGKLFTNWVSYYKVGQYIDQR